jgi:hypothetical protein
LFGRGRSVDVIAPEEHPLEKVFGRELSDLILEAHAAKGVRLHLGSRVARIEDKQVLLQGGEQIDADIVVVGIGVEPRLQFAEAAGLALDRGVLVNPRLQTSDPSIFAAGDIARWPDPHTGESIRVEHWVVAERQGRVAAANMLGSEQPFTMVPFFWTKHFDLSIRYVGHAENGTRCASRAISRIGMASSDSDARAAIWPSLPSNATKSLSSRSWRWKASSGAPREQAGRPINTLLNLVLGGPQSNPAARITFIGMQRGSALFRRIRYLNPTFVSLPLKALGRETRRTV